MRIVFSPKALEDYAYLKAHSPVAASKVRRLLNNVRETPYGGLGKPEPLRYDLSGFWSRRIDREHRLVYTVEDDAIYVVSCRYHYSYQ